jgi:hypothetical protein
MACQTHFVPIKANTPINRSVKLFSQSGTASRGAEDTTGSPAIAELLNMKVVIVKNTPPANVLAHIAALLVFRCSIMFVFYLVGFFLSVVLFLQFLKARGTS